MRRGDADSVAPLASELLADSGACRRNLVEAHISEGLRQRHLGRYQEGDGVGISGGSALLRPRGGGGRGRRRFAEAGEHGHRSSDSWPEDHNMAQVPAVRATCCSRVSMGKYSAEDGQAAEGHRLSWYGVRTPCLQYSIWGEFASTQSLRFLSGLRTPCCESPTGRSGRRSWMLRQKSEQSEGVPRHWIGACSAGSRGVLPRRVGTPEPTPRLAHRTQMSDDE